MGHEQELGTQQPHPLGAARYGVAGVGGIAQVGDHLHAGAILGPGVLEASVPGTCLERLQRFHTGLEALPARFRGCRQHPTLVAVEQHLGAIVECQHTGTGADHRRNPQCPGQYRAVGGGAAPGGEDAADPLGVQAGDIGRTDIVGHQQVGHGRRLGQLDVAQDTQHATADVTQIRGTFGQQPVGQLFLGAGGDVDGLPPGGLGGQPLVDALPRGLGQFRVFEHFLMHRQNSGDLASGGPGDQGLELLAALGDGPLEALSLQGGVRRLTGIVEVRRLDHEQRRHREPRRCSHRFQRLVGGRHACRHRLRDRLLGLA